MYTQNKLGHCVGYRLSVWVSPQFLGGKLILSGTQLTGGAFEEVIELWEVYGHEWLTALFIITGDPRELS